MLPDYYEAHEAEWLEEQELLAELFAEERPPKSDKGERRSGSSILLRAMYKLTRFCIKYALPGQCINAGGAV